MEVSLDAPRGRPEPEPGTSPAGSEHRSRCASCKARFPLESFTRDRRSRNGRSERCRECQAAFYRRSRENSGSPAVDWRHRDRRGGAPPFKVEGGCLVHATAYVAWLWCLSRWKERPKRSRGPEPERPAEDGGGWECGVVDWQIGRVTE